MKKIITFSMLSFFVVASALGVIACKSSQTILRIKNETTKNYNIYVNGKLVLEGKALRESSPIEIGNLWLVERERLKLLKIQVMELENEIPKFTVSILLIPTNINTKSYLTDNERESVENFIINLDHTKKYEFLVKLTLKGDDLEQSEVDIVPIERD